MGTQGLLRDITDLKQVENQLRIEKENLENIA